MNASSPDAILVTPSPASSAAIRRQWREDIVAKKKLIGLILWTTAGIVGCSRCKYSLKIEPRGELSPVSVDSEA